jgi:hypothetical protein
MISSPAHQAVSDLLHEADAAFAAGDADRWAACFEEGGRGRLVYFLRRDAAGAWRIRLLMNSHSHPMEPIT